MINIRFRFVVSAVLLLGLILPQFPLPAVADSSLPNGFRDELVGSLPGPIGLAFTPDGRLLVISQFGTVSVYRDGVLLTSSALDIRSKVCSNMANGLSGIAVDPLFETNHRIYLYYTFAKYGGCPKNATTSPVNRVSRFILGDDNVVDRRSETVLIDNIPSPGGTHNGGDLHFGKDGYLYISTGDGFCDYAADSGCGWLNDAARDEHMLLGKILRITPDGAIPRTNPFRGANSVRCGLTGGAEPGKTCQETFASGLRNPFRMAFDPNSDSTRFYINDVGAHSWEEINRGTAGADYGWNIREGHCTVGSTTDCGPPPAGMTNPIFDYNQATGCASITGGAFVPKGIWPSFSAGTYLFADYVCGKIFELVPSASGSFTSREFASGMGMDSVVSMVFDPDPAHQALYYTTYGEGGQLRRIVIPTPTATPGSRKVFLPIVNVAE